MNLFQQYYMYQLPSLKNPPLKSQDIIIILQTDVSDEGLTGQVDYVIKNLEDLLCITEGKPRNIKNLCIGWPTIHILAFLTDQKH